MHFLQQTQDEVSNRRFARPRNGSEGDCVIKRKVESKEICKTSKHGESVTKMCNI